MKTTKTVTHRHVLSEADLREALRAYLVGQKGIQPPPDAALIAVNSNEAFRLGGVTEFEVRYSTEEAS